MGNVWGVIFGAAFLAYLNQEGLANIGHSINQQLGTNLDVPLYQCGIYGAIIVLTMLIRPEGLIPSARRQAEFHEGVHDTPLYGTQQRTARTAKATSSSPRIQPRSSAGSSEPTQWH